MLMSRSLTFPLHSPSTLRREAAIYEQRFKTFMIFRYTDWFIRFIRILTIWHNPYIYNCNPPYGFVQLTCIKLAKMCWSKPRVTAQFFWPNCNISPTAVCLKLEQNPFLSYLLGPRSCEVGMIWPDMCSKQTPIPLHLQPLRSLGRGLERKAWQPPNLDLMSQSATPHCHVSPGKYGLTKELWRASEPCCVWKWL